MTPARWWAVPGRASPVRVLAVGTVVLLALRLAVSALRTGPVIMADEAGYLMHARVMAGGMPAEMSPSPFYRGGYSVLLAPVVALLDEPVAAYHGVLVVNAVLAACLVPGLFLLLTRGFGTEPRIAAWAAVAGAAYPAVTASSQVALAENLIFPLLVVWLLAAALALRRTSSAGWAALAGASAALLWTAHGRMVVVVALTVAGLAAGLLVRRRREDLVAAAVGLVTLAGGSLAGVLLNDRLREENYDRVAFDELGHAFGGLGDPGRLGNVAENLAGQSWYLLVATLGLAVAVGVTDVPRAARRLWRRRPATGDVPLALVVLTTAGLLAESALWFSTRERPDQLIYGRYVEPVAPVLVALGIVALARAERRARVLAAALVLVALTLVVVAVRVRDEPPLAASRWNVAALPSVTGALDAPVLLVAGLAALGAFAVLALLARRAPAALGAAVLVLWVPTTAYVVNLPVLRSQHDVYPAGWTSPRGVLDAAGATRVAYDNDHYDHVAVKAYQWALPETRFLPFDGAREPVPARFSFGVADAPPAPGARVVWRDRGRPQVLWELER